MLFASLVAVLWRFGLDFMVLETMKRFGGANIDHAFPVALLGGLVGSVGIVALRKWRPLLTSSLLLAAATLSVALALVERDRATLGSGTPQRK